MPKLRIIHKGLLLVAIPLIFGIAFISVLFLELLNCNRLVDREFQLKDAIICHLSTLAAGAFGTSGKALYAATRDEQWKKFYLAKQKQAAAEDKHLRRLLKNEHAVSIPPLSVTYNAVQENHASTTPLLLNLQKMSEEASKASRLSIESLRMLLYSGVAIGTIVSVLLAIFFCLNISNRLLIIVNNAISLSQGTALNLPFRGSDEIAELDQLLYNSASEIRELERFKKEMIGVVSHELKSPLSSVGSFLSSLSAGVYGALSDKALDKANRTYVSVKRLMGLVAELLYLDRLELEMNPENISVDELLATSVDTVNEISARSAIEIKVLSNGQSVFADRNRLVQVIVNLLSNALKFSPPGGVVTIEAHSRDGVFECRVSDQGRGIPESHRKQIFEPFKQVDATDNTTKKGTGLGLTISRSIVEQHGGEIGVDSEAGKGSTFWFKLPQLMNGDTNKQFTALNKEIDSTHRQQKSGHYQSGRFRVLYQGLVMIALPLMFQIGFALVFNHMLNDICKQAEYEEQSMKVLNTLTKAADCIAVAFAHGAAFIYIPDSQFSKEWEYGKTNALRLISNAIQLSKDPDQRRDLNFVKERFLALSATLDHEAKTKESKMAFDKLDFNFRKLFYQLNGLTLKPITAEDVAAEASGPNPIATIEAFKSLTHDSLHTHTLPFFDLVPYLDKTLKREIKISQVAAKQRANMINNLELTLACAIIATVAISTLIAVFLMHSLTSRLRHVMKNTERLSSRAPLDPPIPGHDEIALLDRVLFETGNRLTELETFKRELVSIVSHELRTPLLSISSALELFESGMYGDFAEKGKSRLGFALVLRHSENDRLK